MKLVSPKNENLHEGSIDKKEVARDKLFSPDEDINGYGFGKRTEEEGKTKSDWNVHNAKPGVDISEFYNPSAVDEMDTQNQQTPLKLNFESYNSKTGGMKSKTDLDKEDEDEKEPRSAAVRRGRRGDVSGRRRKSPRTATAKKEKVDRSERNRIKDKPSPIVHVHYNDTPQVLYNPRFMGTRNDTLSEEESDSSEDVDQNEV